MKRAAGVWALVVVMVAGCSHFHVEQIDESPAERTITTRLSGTAWFSSSTAITKLKALQTDKTQSFGADTVGQHGATNTVAALEQIVKILELVRPVP